MRISDWSSDVCSSDLLPHHHGGGTAAVWPTANGIAPELLRDPFIHGLATKIGNTGIGQNHDAISRAVDNGLIRHRIVNGGRSEERRVGKECVGTCSYRGSTYHSIKKHTNDQNTR